MNNSKVICVTDPETQTITKPEAVSWNDASKYCAQKAAEGQADTESIRTWTGLPWVLAVAVEAVLKDWAATAYDTAALMVPSQNGVSRECRWGTFLIASLGFLKMDFHVNSKLNRPEIRVVIAHKQQDIERAKELLAAIEKQVLKSEWLRGMAIELGVDAKGNIDFMAPPTQVDIPLISEQDLVLTKHIMSEVKAGILFPLRFPERCKAAGIDLRRGALLAGRPGTGKTMTARLAARAAIDSGWGVIYIPDARALESALSIAAALSPCLVVCEDIDRMMGKERDASSDRILNALDGLDRTKSVMLICTTNAADRLPAAMLRSGRIGNTILVYDAPDADAARELVQRYLGKFAPVGAGDYDSECAGLLPASIKEVAMKAISHALVRGENGVLICDIQECARVVRAQEEFLKSAEKPDEVKPQRMQVELVVPQDAKHGALEGLSEAQRVLGSRNGNGAKQLAP